MTEQQPLSPAVRRHRRRTAFLNRAKHQLSTNESRLSMLRLILFIGLVGLAYYLDVINASVWYWTAPMIGLAVFFYLIVLHSGLRGRLAQVGARLRWSERSKRQWDNTWFEQPMFPNPAGDYQKESLLGTGPQGDLGTDDLDIFGRFSLLHRLDYTLSDMGLQRLAGRLAAPVLEPDSTLQRDLPVDPQAHQQTVAAVAELRGARALRFRLWQSAASAGKKPQRLLYSAAAHWPGEGSSVLKGRSVFTVVAPLVLLTTYGCGLASLFIDGPFLEIGWRIGAMALLATLGIFFWLRTGKDEGAVDWPAVLTPLRSQCQVIAGRTFRSPLLEQAAGRLAEGRGALDELNRILNGLALKNAGLAWLTANVLFLWDVFFYIGLDRWLAQRAKVFRQLIDTMTGLEVLISFASAADDLEWTPAQLVTDRQVFQGQNIRHPLLVAHAAVGNPVNFQKPGEVFLLTGSNMSGKSTYVRSIGLSYILAANGCPVPAEKLSFSPMAMAAAMRISDSLSSGVSLFYGEVLRLKGILERVGRKQPVLILLDEILRGTNSRERSIAVKALLDYLAKYSVFAVMATHDLELTKFAVGRPITQGHFSETVAQGKMSFDYSLREGPLEATNAIRLLQMEGLPLEYDKHIEKV